MNDHRTQVTPKLLQDAFLLLELIGVPMIQQFLRKPDVQVIPQIHKLVKTQRKRLAKKYHPDLNPKHLERFKRINSVCDLLLTLRYEPPPPPPDEVVVYVYSFGGGMDSGNQTTSSATFF
jgi:hypothetical protein